MNTRNTQPGTMLLESSRCPFCGSRLDVYRETASSGVKGWTGACIGRNGTFDGTVHVPAVCDVKPMVWKPTREEAVSAICRRV